MRIMIAITSLVMAGIGGFFIWWGNSMRDTEFISAIDIEPVFIAIMAVGGLLVGIAFFGILVALCANKCFICLYAPLMLLISLILIVTGVGLLVVRGEADNILDGKDDCKDYDAFEEADDELVNAAQYFCKDECPCAFDSDSRSGFEADGYTHRDWGATKITDCPCGNADDNEDFSDAPGVLSYLTTDTCNAARTTFHDQYIGDNDEYFDFLEWMEDELDCSGFCTKLNFFMFTDINNGDPDDNCKDALLDWIKQQALIGGIVALLVGLWFFLVTIWAYALCYRERKSNEYDDDKATKKEMTPL